LLLSAYTIVDGPEELALAQEVIGEKSRWNGEFWFNLISFRKVLWWSGGHWNGTGIRVFKLLISEMIGYVLFRVTFSHTVSSYSRCFIF